MSEKNEANERAYIKYLISNLRCPVCRHRYSTDDILLMEHKDELWCMAVACSECETKGLVFAIVQRQQAQLELLTDLTPEERASFEERGPITIDDVLDFYDYLEHYSGDMAGLLGYES